LGPTSSEEINITHRGQSKVVAVAREDGFRGGETLLGRQPLAEMHHAQAGQCRVLVRPFAQPDRAQLGHEAGGIHP